MSKALCFLQITAKPHDFTSNGKNFIPNYLDKALTDLA